MSRRDDAQQHWKQAAINNAEESKGWEQRYYAEHQRIVDLALEHLPKVSASNEDDLPGIGKTIALFKDKQPQLVCTAKNCSYFWPCPIYLWATGCDRFVVKIEPRQPALPVGEEAEPK